MSDAPTPLPTSGPTTAQVWWDNAIKLLLALTMLIGTFGLIYLIITGRIPPENKDMALMILTAAIGWTGVILGYFYGSSSGSAQKTTQLANKP